MNTSDARDAIAHINKLVHVDSQACVNGNELQSHSKSCIHMAEVYTLESQSFGRGVNKALRTEVIQAIDKLKAHSVECAKPEKQLARDRYRETLKKQRITGLMNLQAFH